METYTKAREFVSHPTFDFDRTKALEGFKVEVSKGSIDEPTMELLEQFARIPHCYTLQSCYGHFMVEHCIEDRNTNRVADIMGIRDTLHYRIAYIALCIENSAKGRSLLQVMRMVADVDPEYLQFGCADWFWNICVNSYVLQVSPLRNAYEDHFDVNIEDAMRIERTRDRFFNELREIVRRAQEPR